MVLRFKMGFSPRKIIGVFRKNRGRFKDFYLNSMTGLFSGAGMGVFFNLTTNIKFERWINLGSYEIFAAIIYVIFILIVLGLFYILGILIIELLLRDKRRILSFHLNFVSGIYSSVLSFLFVLYYNKPTIRYTIAIMGLVLFFVVAYYTIKKKWPK